MPPLCICACQIVLKIAVSVCIFETNFLRVLIFSACIITISICLTVFFEGHRPDQKQQNAASDQVLNRLLTEVSLKI